MTRRANNLDLFMIGAGGAAAVAGLVGAAVTPAHAISLLLVCYFLIGMCGCGIVIWLGRARLLAYPGLVSATSGLLLSMWIDVMSGPMEELLTITFLTTVFLCYSSIMHAVTPSAPSVRWIPWAATSAIAVMCLSFAAWMTGWAGSTAPLWLKVTATLGAGSSSAIAMLVLPIAIRAERRGMGLETTGPAIALTCPRCAMAQTLRSGRARCEQCRLLIRFQIEEPRCRCGFALYRLTGDTCPECGRPIPSEERWRTAA